MTDELLGARLAGELEAVNGELMDVVRRLTADRWRLRGANAPGWDHGEDEERTVGQIALHTANHHLVQAAIVEAVANGRIDTAVQNTDNAQEAEQNPEPDPAEVLRLLAANGAAGASLLRGLSAEQLASRMTFKGWTMSAEELARQVQIGHVRWHLASIRATIDSSR